MIKLKSDGALVSVITEDGSEVQGVSGVDICIRPGQAVIAEMTVLAALDDVWAQPFMSEQSFLEAAKRYGYRVTKVY